jgi:3-isopropylmalate/(R)-2-methylmalate dehydratase large subunit
MNTLFDKIWDAHVALTVGMDILCIDRHYIHEVTSPQAFEGLRRRRKPVLCPAQVTAIPDHNVPTLNQYVLPDDPLSREQLATLERNCAAYGITIFRVATPHHGIIHVAGPESGLTLPGMTIVCGDSHTSTHGALGCVAFGIGTSEVEVVLAAQSIILTRPRTMRVTVEGALPPGTCSKDLILHVIARLGTGGGTGHFIEFAGSTIRALSMEARMTVCNMSIEMGARGGMIAPDETTFAYLKDRWYAPRGSAWERAVKQWRTLRSDPDARFDREVSFRAEEVEPMITHGTNPATGVPVTGRVPLDADPRALEYMGFRAGERLAGKRVDHVFVGSCTNGRIEDLRAFTALVKGKKKSPRVTAWIVPGSKEVERRAIDEGLRDTLRAAGFKLRQPGCSACLAMNDDKVPPGHYCVSTSNRNFEGRQGPGARTLLAGPLVAAAAAVTGEIRDPRNMF